MRGEREGDSGSANVIGDERVSDILKKVIRAGIQGMLGIVIFFDGGRDISSVLTCGKMHKVGTV